MNDSLRALAVSLVLFHVMACSKSSSHGESAAADAGAGMPQSSASAPVTSAPPSTASSATATTRRQLAMPGVQKLASLRLEGDTLFYCDKAGSHRTDLLTHATQADAAKCGRAQEGNTACDGAAPKSIDVAVSSPPGSPNDVLEIDFEKHPVNGRVHDCAGEGKSLVVGTGAEVTLFDLGTKRSTRIAKQGAMRVAMDADWIVWLQGEELVALPRADVRSAAK